MSATTNSVANGARLDDCHSSIYSLADLTGLRWKKFTATLSIPASPSDDPILEAFSRCLSQDILAVWRKAPNLKKQHNQFHDDDLNTSSNWELKKELWIFWWGNEPSVEDIGLINGITVEPEGSWEEQGLSYECRSLLFKAIHNLVERCLLADNFMRVSKWFLRPYSDDKDNNKSERLSCSFTFFLRGEMTVCTTVEIARHQLVEALTEKHLHQASSGNGPVDVLLSPYGLRASLTGVAFRSQHEPRVKKVMDEWKHFYPISLKNDTFDYDDLNMDCPVPPVVEVVVAGVHMNYPSSYVLLPVQNKNPNVDGPNTSDFKRKEANFQNGFSHDDTMLGSINSSINETVSGMNLEAPGDDSRNAKSNVRVDGLINKSTKTSVSLLSRVLDQSQITHPPQSKSASKDPSSVNVPPFPSENPNSDKTSYWSCLASPLKRVRQKLNSLPIKEEDVDFASRQSRFINENLSHADSKWKPDDSIQTLKSFHHDNMRSSMSTQQNVSNSFYPQITNDCRFVNYSTSPGDCYALPPYCMPDMAAEFPQDNCQNLFQTDSSHLQSNVNVPVSYDSTNNREGGKPPLHIDSQNVQRRTNTTVHEIHESPSQWKKFKLPPRRDEKSHRHGTSVALDTLDFPCGSLQGFARTVKQLKCNNNMDEWSWSIVNSKRRKIEEDPSSHDERDLLSARMHNELNSHVNSNQLVTQHVTVGSVTGELAGMTVPSDPYDFEEEEKDNPPSFALNPYSTDIKLGMWPTDGMPNENKSLINQDPSHLVKQEDASVLNSRQDVFPAPCQSFIDTSNTTKLVPHSLTDKNDLKVSAGDLDHMFDDSDDDGGGMLTPPDDHGDITNEEAITSNNPPFQGSKYDLAMFPTPPSMDSCKSYSPEQENNSTHLKSNLMNHTGMMPASRSKIVLEDPAVKAEVVNQEHNSSSPSKVFGVYGKTLIGKQPLPSNYFPIKKLSSLKMNEFNEDSLPHHLIYTPSWQVQMGSFMNHSNDMHQVMEMEEDLNFRPMSNTQPNMGPDSMAPLTPYVSAHTPASVPLQSPANFSATPAPRTPRNLDSPASSIATPATVGRMNPLSAISSSVAQSDAGVCRASAIYVNLMLSDSVLNLFRDISFDQCTMCVCNDNIHSRDVDLGYLPSLADNLTESQYPCSCGFSAVRNRSLSVNAGLFLEDELEIVGKDLENEILKLKQTNFKGSDENIRSLISFALNQAINPRNRRRDTKKAEKEYETENVASFSDIMDACVEAINGGIAVMDVGNQPKIKAHNCRNILHPWTSSGVYISSNSTDIHPMLQYLKPVLQNAIQRLRSERSFNNIQRVNGPLTWREFCKDNSYALEPLPIPLLLVGQNHDWMTVSPFSLNFWEKLYLEPYAGTTNVSYITICPAVDHIAKAAKLFFQELSSLYEHCRLGWHRALFRSQKDNGILFVGKDNLQSSNPSDWFKTFVDRITKLNNTDGFPLHEIESSVLECVKSYTDACCQILDVLFNTNDRMWTKQASTPNPQKTEMGTMRPPTPVPVQHQIISKLGRDNVNMVQNSVKHHRPEEGSIVLYFVDPFSVEYHSVFSLAVWKCYTTALEALPESLRNSVTIQLVPLKDILQFVGQENRSDIQTIRAQAFSTHAQCRRVMPQMQVRAMTAFGGPAVDKKNIMKDKLQKLGLSTIYSPSFILSNSRRKKKDSDLELDQIRDDCDVLYVSYCLSHDQKWLLASATDQDGELLENFCLNIEVPPRRVSVRRKQRICVKSAALTKLWNFILSLITRSASTNWRIVIGRMGRLGHGEIQEWSKRLNRKNLSNLTKQLSSKCKQCLLTGFKKQHKIISACLTSLEPEGAFTIFPDWVKVAPFGRNTSGGTQVQLKTPEDASCTHIYVFPTSSFVQTAGGTFQAENIDFLPGESSFPMPDFGEQDDLNLMDAVNDLFDGPTSPGNHLFNPSTDDITGQVKPSSTDRLISTDGGNEETSLLQQPLALGYLVSTAPTGPLPDSFWVSCPHAKHRCPVFLRFALHIQVSKDEVQSTESMDDHHQLDSHKTDQVLRYVLENYNALSWLTYDPISRDRRSCLPLHYFVLARLFYSIKELT